MSGRPRTAAALPGPGYKRPRQVSESGLVVSVVTEDGSKSKTFNFSNVDAPEQLVLDLVASFAKLSGPGGRWRSMSSIQAGEGMVRHLAATLPQISPEVKRAKDVSPEVWWQWRYAIEKKVRWPGQISRARTVLSYCDGLPATTRQAMRARAKQPKSRRTYDSYSRKEFQSIRKAALRIVDDAQARIDTNSATLATYRAGLKPADAQTIRAEKMQWTAGALLDHLSRTATLPSFNKSGFVSKAEVGALLDMRGTTHLAEALFPSSVEIFSLLVLFVCEQAFNLSALDSMTVDVHRADDGLSEEPIYVVDSDKPRRGPASRYSTNSFAGHAAKVWETAVAITDPARAALASLGFPEDALFIAKISGNSWTHPSRFFRLDWSFVRPMTTRLWHERSNLIGDNGEALRVTLMRLRLSEQVLNQRRRHNSDAVSEDVYRGPDPLTKEEAERTILLGIQNAFEHAVATSEMMKLSPSEMKAAKKDPAKLAAKLKVEPVTVKLLLAGQLDTPTAACLDFTNSPFASAPGDPCPASFFSCFFCGNAVATPEHLPKLVTLHDALGRIYGIVTEPVWTADFAAVFDRLSGLLDRSTTEAEREAARHQATDEEKEIVDRLLRRGYDA